MKKYFKAKGETNFFGTGFMKGELKTESELIKFVRKQLKEGAGETGLKHWLTNEMDIVWLNPKNTETVLEHRFEKRL